MLDEAIKQKIIKENRLFTKGDRKDDIYSEMDETDQERKLPQPPLCKAPMRADGVQISLPMDFENLSMEKPDLLSAIRDRHSSRV